MNRPARYERILRDWPPAPVADGQGKAGLGRVGRGLRAKAEAVQRGEGKVPKRDSLRAATRPPDDLRFVQSAAAGGALAGLAGLAAIALPVIIGLVGLFALTGGGPAGLLKGARSKAYGFARWGGNVQPWIELRPDKVVRRAARRRIGRVAGKTFSWPRIFGL